MTRLDDAVDASQDGPPVDGIADVAEHKRGLLTRILENLLACIQAVVRIVVVIEADRAKGFLLSIEGQLKDYVIVVARTENKFSKLATQIPKQGYNCGLEKRQEREKDIRA